MKMYQVADGSWRLRIEPGVDKVDAWGRRKVRVTYRSDLADVLTSEIRPGVIATEVRLGKLSPYWSLVALSATESEAKRVHDVIVAGYHRAPGDARTLRPLTAGQDGSA